MMRLYFNTAVATIALFGLLSGWGMYHALHRRALSPTYRNALMISHVPLAALACCFIGLHGVGYLSGALALPAVYYVIALAASPCVWCYTTEQSARGQSCSIALACLFTCAMVVRALQSGVVHH